MIELAGKKFPFGGACNQYYNLRHNITYDVENLDLVRVRDVTRKEHRQAR